MLLLCEAIFKKSINSFYTCENRICFTCQFVSIKIDTSCLLRHADLSILWPINVVVTLDQLAILYSFHQLKMCEMKNFLFRKNRQKERTRERQTRMIFFFFLSLTSSLQIGYLNLTLSSIQSINSDVFQASNTHSDYSNWSCSVVFETNQLVSLTYGTLIHGYVFMFAVHYRVMLRETTFRRNISFAYNSRKRKQFRFDQWHIIWRRLTLYNSVFICVPPIVLNKSTILHNIVHCSWCRQLTSISMLCSPQDRQVTKIGTFWKYHALISRSRG